MSVTERICEHIRLHPHCTERDIARALYGISAVQQQVNRYMRDLVMKGIVLRSRHSGVFTYTLVDPSIRPAIIVDTPRSDTEDLLFLSEDIVKKLLETWLIGQGYRVFVRMGKEQGIDMDALRESHRWIIEVKGAGSRPEMRVNYFLAVLGETLQRMNDPQARYSIALPDLPQYRRLWTRLPILAKVRTGITAIFVRSNGDITELTE